MTDLLCQPSTSFKGQVEVPGDKSISHRAIMIASLAQGVSTIDGCLMANDCFMTVNAFRSMGVQIESFAKHSLRINGVGKHGLVCPKKPIDCGNSGTTMRLLSGILAAQPFAVTLTGDASLQQRPMLRIANPLNKMGAMMTTTAGCPPLNIQGTRDLEGIVYPLPEASAQVKSCVLLAGMHAMGETTVVESILTRDHTERMLTAFAYPIERSGSCTTIRSVDAYQGVALTIPGDFSSAAFLIVATLLLPQSELWIKNVGINPTRTGCLSILKQMGATIEVVNRRHYGDEPVADIYVCSSILNGVDISPTFVPSAIDEFPILFVAAACAKGVTRLHGAKELRYKESDRIAVMVRGLQALGVDAQALDDGVLIQGGVVLGGEVDCDQDHRVAMSFAIAGLVAKTAVLVKNCENIATSFPAFVSISKQLGLNIRELNHVK